MMKQLCLYSFVLLIALTTTQICTVSSTGGGGGPGDTLATINRYSSQLQIETPNTQQTNTPQHPTAGHTIHSHHHHGGGGGGGGGGIAVGVGSSSGMNLPATVGSHALYHPAPGSGHIESRNSYNLLSEAMSQAVSNEFSSQGGGSGSADGACHADDLDCYNSNVQDRLGMEAIRTLHRQLDDDDNGNIDLSESDDFLREELKYAYGYEKRQKAFHFNDDMHISVKELWEAWLRSEVHNWTMEQTTDWLAQSVQLPQYVELFKIHKVTGASLPRLAVNNMHYVSNVLGIKDPIHKQKIALKAMDVVLFGPPRETGTRWKDYILVTLLLSAIIGCWYAYQQNKNAKRHLRRMAQDMEGLQRAEQSLQEMQKELERARMEQENVATEKMDLERRLKEAPSLSSSSSDLEVQQLKKEIEMLRNELSRAEIELVDNCWAPPPQLQSWLQYTYELESKNHLKKRVSAEKQLQSAREACEKLRKKRTSLVGAFVSTHGKSIDDVDRSIVEARNSLSDVTNELQERLHRWKQIEQCLGLNIVNNNGLPYLESVLYGRNNGGSSVGSSKGSRGRMTSSTDDLDDESVQAKCYDLKAPTWYPCKSTPHISQDNNSNTNINSNMQTQTQKPSENPLELKLLRIVERPLVMLTPAEEAAVARKWLNNTVTQANNQHHQHHHLYNQHHQQLELQQNLIKEIHQADTGQQCNNITMNPILSRSMSIHTSSTNSLNSNSNSNNSNCQVTKSRSYSPNSLQQSLATHQYHFPVSADIVNKPPPPHLRTLYRRHTVIPKWQAEAQKQEQDREL